MPEGPVQRKADFLAERRAGQPSTFRHIMFHLRVLRSGWGLLLFAVLFCTFAVMEAAFVEHYRPRAAMQGAYMAPHDILDPLLELGAVFITTFLLSLLEQRRISDYGFSSPTLRNLFAGFATAGVLVAVTEYALHAKGLMPQFRATPDAMHIARYAAVWLGIMLMFALLEEMLTRSYLQHTLTRALAFLYRRFLGLPTGLAAGFWTASLMLSACFAWLYRTNPGQTNAGLAGLFAMGLLYSFSLWRTGNLWWAVGFHAAWDFTQAYVFGQWSGGLPIRDRVFSWLAGEPVDYTGGQAGLDGSYTVYLLLVVAAASLLIFRKQPIYPELGLKAKAPARQ